MHRRFRLLVALALVAGPLGLTAAPAQAEPDVAVCSANVTWAYAPGLTVVPAVQAVTATMLLTCSNGDDAGLWTLNIAGASFEACEAGEGSFGWAAGSTSPEGPVALGGVNNYVRVGFHTMTVFGTISVPAVGETHNFVAYLGWVPNLAPGLCVAPPMVAAQSPGLAVISDL